MEEEDLSGPPDSPARGAEVAQSICSRSSRRPSWRSASAGRTAHLRGAASEPRLEVRHLDDSPEDVHHYLVRDNGSGIPENYLKKLFTPFFRAEGGGAVIGLAIVDKILKACGGEVKAYNDSGACFEFTIKDFKAA